MCWPSRRCRHHHSRTFSVSATVFPGAQTRRCPPRSPQARAAPPFGLTDTARFPTGRGRELLSVTDAGRRSRTGTDYAQGRVLFALVVGCRGRCLPGSTGNLTLDSAHSLVGRARGLQLTMSSQHRSRQRSPVLGTFGGRYQEGLADIGLHKPPTLVIAAAMAQKAIFREASLDRCRTARRLDARASRCLHRQLAAGLGPSRCSSCRRPRVGPAFSHRCPSPVRATAACAARGVLLEVTMAQPGSSCPVRWRQIATRCILRCRRDRSPQFAPRVSRAPRSASSRTPARYARAPGDFSICASTRGVSTEITRPRATGPSRRSSPRTTG